MFGIAANIILLSNKFKNLIERYVEDRRINFIQIKINSYDCWLLNIIKLGDYMGCVNSVYTTFESNNKSDKISKLVIIENKISKNVIFRLLDRPTHIFITESLKEKIESESLKGIRFFR